MNQNTCERCCGYRIVARTSSVNGQHIAIGHNPDAADPWASWISRDEAPHEYDLGHYHRDESEAWITFGVRLKRLENDPYMEE